MIRPRGYAEQTPDPAQLVADHMNLVRKIAWYFHGRTGRFIEIDDLLQVGYLGLVDASRRYRPQEGVSFSSYAAIRVRGAVVDFLRSNSNLCRTTIAMRQKVTQVQQALTKRLQRDPDDTELAEELGVSLSELTGWQARFASNRLQSLDDVYTDHSLMFSDDAQNPERSVSDNEMLAQLRAALTELNERQALVLQLYYLEELNVH